MGGGGGGGGGGVRHGWRQGSKGGTFMEERERAMRYISFGHTDYHGRRFFLPNA